MLSCPFYLFGESVWIPGIKLVGSLLIVPDLGERRLNVDHEEIVGRHKPRISDQDGLRIVVDIFHVDMPSLFFTDVAEPGLERCNHLVCRRKLLTFPRQENTCASAYNNTAKSECSKCKFIFGIGHQVTGENIGSRNRNGKTDQEQRKKLLSLRIHAKPPS